MQPPHGNQRVVYVPHDLIGQSQCPSDTPAAFTAQLVKYVNPDLLLYNKHKKIPVLLLVEINTPSLCLINKPAMSMMMMMMIIVNKTRALAEGAIARIRYCPYQMMTLLDGCWTHDGRDAYKDYRAGYGIRKEWLDMRRHCLSHKNIHGVFEWTHMT